jgi:hypothetical protein
VLCLLAARCFALSGQLGCGLGACPLVPTAGVGLGCLGCSFFLGLLLLLGLPLAAAASLRRTSASSACRSCGCRGCLNRLGCKGWGRPGRIQLCSRLCQGCMELQVEVHMSRGRRACHFCSSMSAGVCCGGEEGARIGASCIQTPSPFSAYSTICISRPCIRTT